MLVNLVVAVQVGEVDVASLEILLVASGINDIKVGILRIFGGREHALGLVSVEHADGIAHGCQDVVHTIDGRGVVAVSQRLHLVLVMA